MALKYPPFPRLIRTINRGLQSQNPCLVGPDPDFRDTVALVIKLFQPVLHIAKIRLIRRKRFISDKSVNPNLRHGVLKHTDENKIPKSTHYITVDIIYL